ncbi:hypothetical protein MAE02_43330 [Microvirga aerophila]|uniref:Uncharacterized protein n=1 Tax=Microvirga aerophila TaxID=670291 RepID=A0A512BXQ7_9HYPH|nr:hypothetical protein MAE02_43330 [Microvirga aerophila]
MTLIAARLSREQLTSDVCALKPIRRLCSQGRERSKISSRSAPPADWPEAVEKVRYLLGLFAQNVDAADPRRRKLIDQVVADFDHRLNRSATTETTCPKN